MKQVADQYSFGRVATRLQGDSTHRDVKVKRAEASKASSRAGRNSCGLVQGDDVW